MRVGLIRMKYDQAGGAEQTLGLLAGGLLTRGHEVHVITTKWEGPRPQGLQVHYVALDHTSDAARAMDWAVMARAQAGQWGLEACLALDRVPGIPVYRAGDGCHAAWLERRAPYVSALKRLSFPLNPKHRRLLDLEQRTLGSPDLRTVIANSRLVAGELEHYYGLGPERVEVVYNGVDPQRVPSWPDPRTKALVRAQAREELDLPASSPVLLFLGSGFERKGLAFALRALVHLPRALLLVAGRDRPGPYQRLAHRLGLGQRVRLLGQRQGVGRLLAAADVLVLPTIYDPCANSCLEALAAGVPVVTTRANGAAELVQAGVSGYVVEQPADLQALARACEQALDLGPFVCQALPSLEQWLERVERILTQSAGQGNP